MNDSEWTDANARFLRAALDWVRGRLERRVRPALAAGSPARAPLAPSAPSVASATEARPVFSFFRRQPSAAAGAAQEAAAPIAPPRIALPPATETQPLAPPADVVSLAKDMMPPPALLVVAQRLGLSDFERNLLLLCAATELDPAVASLCAQVQGDAAMTYPTFALALSLFDDAAWDAMSPERPLRYWRLIEVGQPAATTLSASPLRADERIVNFLNGITYLDDRLAPLVSPLLVPGAAGDTSDGAPDPLPPSHRAIVEAIVDRVGNAPAMRSPPVIQLLGNDLPSKRAVAAAAGRALGRHTYRLDSTVLPTALTELDALARLWQRESMLLPVALYLETDVADGARAAVDQLLHRLDCTVFLAARHLWPGAGQTPLAIDVDKPTADEQRACWRAASPAIAEDVAERLSEQFDLNLSAIRGLAQREAAVTHAESSLEDRLWDAARALTRPGLDTLSRRIVSHAGWNDLVLPSAETALLHQIADQVAHRGRVYRTWGFAARMSRGLGISALFAGATGTGKTLAAEALANHLRLDLFRIDLSAVVSKYIGETEANLRRLFDAAEGGGAILFFDEADALFGKRTEVKDSHDRYANIEINYLLQRMESYAGLAILATNMKSALDQAFLRRLRFVVDFPFPGPAEREAMWRKAFPPSTPTERLDFPRLARLNVTGGHIAVISVNAAFQAARGGTPVTMSLILNAARVEFRKLDRPIHEADFRWTGAVA